MKTLYNPKRNEQNTEIRKIRQNKVWQDTVVVVYKFATLSLIHSMNESLHLRWDRCNTFMILSFILAKNRIERNRHPLRFFFSTFTLHLCEFLDIFAQRETRANHFKRKHYKNFALYIALQIQSMYTISAVFLSGKPLGYTIYRTENIYRNRNTRRE